MQWVEALAPLLAGVNASYWSRHSSFTVPVWLNLSREEKDSKVVKRVKAMNPDVALSQVSQVPQLPCDGTTS